MKCRNFTINCLGANNARYMTEEEYDALDELWTHNPPKVSGDWHRITKPRLPGQQLPELA